MDTKKQQPDSFYQDVLEHMTFLYDKEGLGMFHRLYDFLFHLVSTGQTPNVESNPHSLFFCTEERGQEENKKLATLLSTILAVCFVGETAFSLPSITGVSIRSNDFLFDIANRGSWDSSATLKEMERYLQEHNKEFSPVEQETLMRCCEVYEAMRGEIYNIDERDHKEIVGDSYLKTSSRYYSRQHPWLATFYEEYVFAGEVFSFFEKEVYRLSTKDSFDAKPPTSKKVM